MKFGIIGTGNISHVHAAAIGAMDGGRLHSVLSRDVSKAAVVGRNFGVKCHTRLDDFLADEELEIVTIATPSGDHLASAVAALRAGKHVICEKPLEITTSRIDILLEAAAASGRTLAAILNRRFHPAMDAFKAACDGGRFGTMSSASCQVKWFRDQAYYDSAAWRGTRHLDGGGVLMNQAIHAIDSLLHLAGPVAWVQAATACLAHDRIEVEDTAVAALGFKNGALGTVEATTAAWSRHGHPARIQICGSGGSAFLADEIFEIWEFENEKPEDEEILATLMSGGGPALGANDPRAISCGQHQRNFEEVVQAIRENRVPSTSGAEARKAVALIEAIYESASNEGARIWLPK